MLSVIILSSALTLGLGFTDTVAQDSAPAAKSLFELKAESWDGKKVNLADYKGKVVVVVNVASQCGFTPHYTGLQELYKKYKDKGLVVLAFPCNQFGGQEPGSNKEIHQFCSSKFNVTFPLMAKVDVKGAKQSPVFKYLTSTKLDNHANGKVRWNFEKFVVDRNGKLIARYRSTIKPMSKSMIGTVEKALAQKS